jgi:hypothetical protein
MTKINKKNNRHPRETRVLQLREDEVTVMLHAFLAEHKYETRICSPGNPHGDVSAIFALDRVARHFWKEGFTAGLRQYADIEEASTELKAATVVKKVERVA